jgi:predicted ATPase/transcriptional regulator with GAF, ATPase, and Fis domain
MVIAPGYEVHQELSRSECFSLYRGRCRADGSSVLLKAPRDDATRPMAARLLKHEYELLSGLSVPGVVRVRELLDHDRSRCLVLEDQGGMPLHALLTARRFDLRDFFRLALQLTTTLTDLHRRGITHNHINPRSILVDAATSAVCLTDLSLASQAGEMPAPPLPLFQRGGLVYLSPEQTGRINRAIDYRTDFYSLGVVFYELLTGSPPFHAADVLELIHQHIAGIPPAPAELDPQIPATLSDIVMKLLAKTAEERYQSALGLQEDLARSASDWAAHGRIAPFTLGQRDVPDRFLIPQRLYGRAREVTELLGTFDRVCQEHAGPASMLLVTGYAGIGKTALIQELYKPIIHERGYFISGKFDQVVRGVPFGALIQAFRGLVRQLLGESEAQLAAWRVRLSQVLGAQAGVLTEVIPEIELIIGRQPPPPALGPSEALNRFQMVVQNFVGALARREHPLVVFLDDLQWADTATLSLLQPLLTSHEVQMLLLMGAYRDNDVDVGHPLLRTLGELESAGVELQRVVLGPLQPVDLRLLVRDTLHGTLQAAEPLARLVLEKTGGNPFFVIQFLKTLRQEGFIEFDYERCCWTYDLEAIARAPLTDNVIDLMTRRIQRLSARTQHALTLAACIGNPFDQSTLAIVSERSPEAVADDLQEAIDEGLILPVARDDYAAETQDAAAVAPHTAYAFLHDRVQQGAYAMIPDAGKQPVHLTVGRLLRSLMETDRSEEKLFDVVHHLNRGGSLLCDEHERVGLARLNLSAGRKAKSSTAYAAALDYFNAGLGLLTDAHWEREYDVMFALHVEAAECEYLCGNFDSATTQLDELLQRATTKLDKARVYSLRLVQHEHRSRYADALASARAGLALFGVSFPTTADDKQAALDREIEVIQSLLGGRSIEALLELPVMTDPETRMVMSILTDIWSSAYLIGDALLACLISATMVRLSLVHGNLAESAYGYVTHAITVGPVRGDYLSAYEFGRLALKVNERFNDSRRRAKIYQQFHAHVNLWRQPLHTCIPYAREACRSGLEAGDFLYAAYGACTEAWPALVASQDLAQFLRDYTPSLALIRKLKNTGFADAHQLILNWARALVGETNAPVSLSTAGFDADDYAETYAGKPFFTMFHLTARLHLAYLFEDHEQALAAAQKARRIAHHLAGTIWPVLLDFWGGLTLVACANKAGEDERRAYLQEGREAQAALAMLAENCAENYRCPSLLLAAEIERVAGREMAALDLYEQASRYAAQIGMIQYQALANELYARFWRDRQQLKAAGTFMAEARDQYAKWGATAKVRALERRYADLLERHASDSIDTAPTAIEPEAGGLDLVSVMKAAQAIAGEVELKKLPARLLRIAIENAGAERGSLILEHGGEFYVHTEGLSGAAAVRVVTLDEAENLPRRMVQYVQRTAASIVLADAQRDDHYGSDPYIVEHKPRSVMCVPVLNQARLVGVLYLENRVVSGVFTPDRIQTMQLLSSQAAISLENAQLYDEMRREVAYRRQAEETLRALVEGTAAVTGGDFYRSLVLHLASALQVRYAFVAECQDQARSRARTLAFWKGEGFGENFEYDVTKTPCAKVLGGTVCHYADNVRALFPHDQDLFELNIESYLGLPIVNTAGQVIGHLAVLDDKPMPEDARSQAVLKIFAARAGAEFERVQAEEDLRRALDDVQILKNRLQEENVYLQEEIRREHNFEEMVGRSQALLEMLQKVELVAPTDSTVLLYGETGTGKELVARAVHDRSGRKDRPLVKVNCGAISAGLVESELFGHLKGAFTGALERRIGRFELANGGTIFLDEIGELPQDTQVKLLRVLQEQEFEPVGSSRSVRVDVRVIAATNRDLEEAVRTGRFRADLFYRLHVFPIRVPPLRERRSDIPLLVMFFLARFAKKLGRKIEAVPQGVMDALTAYDWPGNIRELQNLIERAVVLSQGRVLKLEPSLLPAAGDVPREAGVDGTSRIASPTPTPGEALPLEEVERRHILGILRQTRGVIEGAKGAARILKLHPNTLRSRIKRLGISHSDYEIS